MLSFNKEDGVWLQTDEQSYTKHPDGAKDMEEHRWEESFDGYACKHKDELMNSDQKAKTWQDVHQGFAEYETNIWLHARKLRRLFLWQI